jgi:hypothetical protein
MTWLKVADLFARTRRGRKPVLIGTIGPYRLVVVDRHEPGLGEPRATLFIAPPEKPIDRKPITPTGRAEASRRLAELRKEKAEHDHARPNPREV